MQPTLKVIKLHTVDIVIPFEEQVGFPSTKMKQCIYAYVGA